MIGGRLLSEMMRTGALDESKGLVAIVGSKLQERGREMFAN